MPEQEVTLEIYPSLGQNTALNPAELPQGSQRKAHNAVMYSVNTIGKRNGSIPVTTTPLGAAAEHLTEYKSSPSIVAPDLLAASGTTLYKFNGTDGLIAQIMTDALFKADIYTVGFTDANNVSVLFICDGADVKQYDGSAVKKVVPAANDALPNPPNDLANINVKKPIYCWTHTGHLFMTDGKDIVWYSKRYFYNYWPSVQFNRWVRNNDYITGPGVTFNNVCLIPMRRGWGILTGSVFDDGTVPDGFSGNQFLNTVNGNIAPRGIARITYPNGSQTIAYLSDDGVHEIYDTGFQDTGIRQYSTRSLMKEKLDFNAFGFTEAEKKAASAYFDQEWNLYILMIKRNAVQHALVCDTRNNEWYVWMFPWDIKAITRYNGVLYFVGSTGHLHKFGENQSINSDWNDKNKSSGAFVDMDIYSGLTSFEFSGDQSYLHYYLVEAQQWTVKSTLDVSIIYGSGTQNIENALKNEIFVWGVSSWAEAEWANLDYTDTVNNAKRLVFHKKAKYFQRRWRNNRDEPVLILKEKYIGTVSGR